MSTGIITSAYIAASVLFILSLGGLSHQERARRGNLFGILGMAIAIVATIYNPAVGNYALVIILMVSGGGIGALVAARVQMTAMPQLVALLHSFVGLAAVLVGFGTFLDPTAGYSDIERNIHNIEIYLGILIGAITFTGSVIAFGKLQGIINSRPLTLPGRHLINIAIGLACLWLGWHFISMGTLDSGLNPLIIATVLALIFGAHMVLAIGGADMPVVVSLLNSLSGVAAAFTGFVIGNNVLIIAGSMVGAAGLILTFIMCKAMNRTLPDVLFKAFGGSGDKDQLTRTKVGSDPEEVAMVLDGVQKVIVVPGYGMAVSQSQHAVKEFADMMEAEGCEVAYAIHPVAGRMPGHMNVLLAEANVPYEQLIEMENINSEFPDCDVALVIGANDTTNPAARTGEGPLAGMPILDVDKARVVVMIKRSLSVGYAGVDNDLFYMDKTMMLFGDGKKMMNELNSALKEL